MNIDLSPVPDLVRQVTEIDVNQQQLTRCLALLDLTSLNEDDDAGVIHAVCAQAVTPFGKVASVCVYPQFVAIAKTLLQTQAVKVATVANFPSGARSLEQVILEIHSAIQAGAAEIDVVFPYQRYMMGETAAALDFVSACKLACSPRVTLKIILETGALLDQELIAVAVYDVVKSGADFVKTSTGKIKTGATLEAVAAMLLALKALQRENFYAGCKISGGVANALQALRFLKLADIIMGKNWATSATLRFGASSLLVDLVSKISNLEFIR